MRYAALVVVCLTLLSSPLCSPLNAQTKELIAVIVETDGCAIETLGGYRIKINSTTDARIEIRELSDPLTSKFQRAHVLDFDREKQNNHWTLHRQPNQLKSQCNPGLSAEHLGLNGMLILQKLFEDEDQPATVIEVDGITVCDLGANKIASALKLTSMTCDVVIATGCPDADNESVDLLAKKMAARFVLLAQDNDAVNDDKVIKITDRNLIAVSRRIAKEPEGQTTQWIKISDQPWKMPDSELKNLFDLKEASSAQSRAVFAPLSVEQMNFVPGDGSHTPRWNTEHMMGRELLFFSQIYNAITPAIPVMNLNPKQMPQDYVAAHSDWTGHEEALLTLRVEAFSRRFAFLLADLPLDEKTIGSKMWSPRGLLEQMERHYKQHTEYVKKKMELENWPKE